MAKVDDYLQAARTASFAKMLIDSGADVNQPSNAGSSNLPHGTTPLHLAAWSGDVELVKVLLDAGAHANARNADGLTPIQLGARSEDVAKLLLGAGADPAGASASRRIENADRYVEASRTAPFVKMLIDAGGNVNRPVDHTTVGVPAGTTALHLAAWGGNNDLAKTLLEAGAQIDARDADGRTPLHLMLADAKGWDADWAGSLRAENERLVGALLRAGADPTIADKDGVTAAQMMEKYGVSSSEVKQPLQQAAVSQGAPESRPVEVEQTAPAVALAVEPTALPHQDHAAGRSSDEIDRVNALLAGLDPAMIDGGDHVAQYLGMSDESAPAARTAAPATPTHADPAAAQAMNAGKEPAPAVNTIEVSDNDRAVDPQAAEPAGSDAGKVELKTKDGDDETKVKALPIFDKDGYEIPKSVKAHYVAVEGKFVDRKTEQVGFEDTGRKLSTKSEDRKVIENMIAVAAAKNWGTLQLQGTEDFRRQAWMAAEVAGLKSIGYEPTAQDRAAVEARREEMRVGAGEKAAAQTRENSIENKTARSQEPAQAKAADIPAAAAEKPQTVASEKPQTVDNGKGQAAVDPAQATTMTPEALAELRKEMDQWRQDKTKEEIAELTQRLSDPAQRRQHAQELLRAAGRDPAEFFQQENEKPAAIDAQQSKSRENAVQDPAAAGTAKAAQQDSTREAAARLVLETEMNNLGLPEAERAVLRDNLNAAISDARGKGVELEVPEPMVVDRTAPVEQEKGIEVSQSHATPGQEIDR
jgi:hypothetical protein